MKICRYFSAVLHIKQRKHHKEGLHLKKTAKLHLICTRNVGWATNWHVEPLQQTDECLQAPQRHSIYTCSTLNWNRRKWFNIEIITHLHLCNHIQGWLSIYTQFSLSHGVWLVPKTHRSPETVILSQRKELYNHRAIVIVRVNRYVSSRSLLIFCYTALKVEGQIIAADQNSLPKLLLKLLHVRFNARQIESLQAKIYTHSLKPVAHPVI